MPAEIQIKKAFVRMVVLAVPESVPSRMMGDRRDKYKKGIEFSKSLLP
jgi:hypothetical protein